MFDDFVGLALKGLKFLQKSVMDAAFRTLKDMFSLRKVIAGKPIKGSFI